MSVRIRISYETDKELEQVLQLLRGYIHSYKVAKKEGRWKNAYLYMKVLPGPSLAVGEEKNR